jgi:PAS domain S-box-containing protein
MDKESRSYLNKIIQLLELYAPMRLSVSSISRELGINIHKTTPYMNMLELIGEVTMVPFGRAKLYTISKRVPYSNLLNLNGDAIVILDEKGRVQMVNKKFLATFNFSREKDIIGRNITDLDIFSIAPVKKNIKMLINGSPYEKEIQYIDEESQRIYLIRFVSTVSNRGTISIMIYIGDITNQKSCEEKCTILDQKLKTIFDESQMGIIFIDVIGNVLNANNASLKMLGFASSQDIAGLNISELLGTTDWAMMKNIFINEASIACNFYKPLSNNARKKEGIAFFEITLAPIKSGINEKLIVEYAMLFRNITTERNVMLEMNMNQARYKSFFENMCNGMVIVSVKNDGSRILVEEFIIKDINKAGEELLKVRKDDVIGKKLMEIFPDLPNRYEQVDKVVNHGIPQYLPPEQYRRRENEPVFSHYLFRLPSNEIASLLIR